MIEAAFALEEEKSMRCFTGALVVPCEPSGQE
jgi:hypothetical protein